MPKMPTCPDCDLFVDICICSQILPIFNTTKVSFVVNRKESFKITNTAKLAFRMLQNSELHIYGMKNEAFNFSKLSSNAEQRPLLLFPLEGAKELSSDMMFEKGV
ncbi:MAG: DTW domain-containing protein [Oligoflexales bacterium]|nr:DTW domain-containing protein [Oligoflexales bacterium]